jgi:hypothetical protein
MTNQIRFYPFSDRIDRFQMATITLATWDIGAALMTSAIEAQLSDHLADAHHPGAVGPSRRARPDHLDLLEAHAVFVMREVAAECERPVLLCSGGTDSGP